MRGEIIIVDDDAPMVELLEEQLTAADFRVRAHGNASAALEDITQRGGDVVVTDLRMPGMSGSEFCREVTRRRPDIPVIVMTAYGSLDAAVASMRAGAYDFITKPFDFEVLELALQRALTHRDLRHEVARLRRQTGDSPGYADLLGTSKPMQRVYELIDRFAPLGVPVILFGESGTGKERVARALHDKGPRQSGPFVAVNCAAMPEQLLESELFGHERGAFTDAHRPRVGLVRQAQGGVLFLDEIGDMPQSLQPKLLRALQERVVRPVGCDREVEIDVRVIAATHRDLVKEVAEGRFREDLFYRLNVVTIDIPPLRERGDDVLLMAEHFIQEVAARDQSESPRLTTGAVEALVGYRWPGNVRELKNCVEYAMALSNGDAIGREHLPEIIARASGEVSKKPDPEDTGESGPFETLFAVERRHVLRVYRAVGGNKSKAARILGVDRKTLHARLQRYGAD